MTLFLNKEMADIAKEIQKLKALVNQKQTTAIFSNKSNESTKLALGDAELYINDMTRKFSFTRAGTKNPIMIDARNKTIENVEYINGVKVEDITSSAIAIDELRKDVDDHEVRISKVEADVDVHEERLDEVKNTVDDHEVRISNCENKDIEQDERISKLEDGVVSTLINIYKDEPLDVTYTYSDAEVGVFKLTFNRELIDDNFKEGQHNLFKLELKNHYSYIIGYIRDENGITWPNSRVSFDGKTIRLEHQQDSTTNELIVYEDALISRTYELTDPRLTNAVNQSILTEKGIVIDNNKLTINRSLTIKKGYLDVATNILMMGKAVAFADHTHSNIDNDILWNGNLNMKTGTKTTTELKMNWLDVVTIPVAMNSANKYNHTIVMSRNTYLIQKDDYLKASFTFKDAKDNVQRTYTLEHKFTATSDRVYIADDVLWTPNGTDYELIFEDLPYDSNGRAYVDCSELAIYHDYTSDVIEPIINKNGDIIAHKNLTTKGTFNVGTFRIQPTGSNYIWFGLNSKGIFSVNHDTGLNQFYEKWTFNKDLIILGQTTFGKAQSSQSVKILDYVEEGGWYVKNPEWSMPINNLSQVIIYIKEIYSLLKQEGRIRIRVTVKLGNNTEEYDGYAPTGPTCESVYSSKLCSWEANSLIWRENGNIVLKIQNISGNCTTSTCSVTLNEFSLSVNDNGTSPTTIDQYGNITLNSTMVRFNNRLASNDFARIMMRAWGNNDGYLEIATADDANEPIYVRQYSGNFVTCKRTLKLLDKNGNTIIPGIIKSSIDSNEQYLDVPHHIRFHNSSTNWTMVLHCTNNQLQCDRFNANGSWVNKATIWGGSQTVTHKTNVTGEIGTFCESTGAIYDGYDHISHTDCICNIKTSTTLNKKIVGIICSEDEFASHGDVYVRVSDTTGLEIGDILCPDENGYGRKASESELMYMMMYAIPRPKITSLDTAFEGYIACFLV